MLLTSEGHFSNRDLPVQLFHTQSSSNLQWHSHEFTEIAIMFDGSCTYETDFSSKNITKGDVMFIPRGGNHRYLNEKNVSLMNVLFMLENLTFPYQDIFADKDFTALFRIRSEFCRKMQFYPHLHLADKELEEVKSILMPAWERQKENLPGATLGVYGSFLQLIPIFLGADIPALIPLSVISLKDTRTASSGFKERSLDKCQEIASPSRSGSVAR